MTTRVRMSIAGVMLAAIGGLLYVAGSSGAGDEKGPQADIQKIADLIKKGSKEDAKKLAEATAKKTELLEEVMESFKIKKKGGFPIASFKETDGIESKLRELARDTPKKFDGLEQLAHVTAAIAQITHAKAPSKDQGKKLRKEWLQWSKDMEEASMELAKAAAAKGSQDVKTAAAKVNAACNNCHSIYRQ